MLKPDSVWVGIPSTQSRDPPNSIWRSPTSQGENLQKSFPYLFNKMEDVIKPLERGPAMTEPHGSPEVHWVKHEAAYTHVQLVCHCEPLLCPHKVPLSSTESLEKLAQHKVSCPIATKKKGSLTKIQNSCSIVYSGDCFFIFSRAVFTDIIKLFST